MPTADSFVGMPFMRPTLRMHCFSTLQRHTITGDSQGWKRRVEGKGSPVAQSPKLGPAGWYVCICMFMHMYVFMCGEGCNAPLCVCLSKHESVCPAKNVQVCTEICCPWEPACMCVIPAPHPASFYVRPHRSPGLTSDRELPPLAITADNYRDYIFAWLHPVQGQGEVGMGTCWYHKQ